MSDHDAGGPILLTCHAADCKTRAHAQLGHLENLLAAGPWRCAHCSHLKEDA